MTQNYQRIYDYIIDNIDASGYNKNPHFIEEKLQFLHNTFQAEYGWHYQKSHNLSKSVSEWLAGLPSSINTAWRNHEILELCEKWGRIKPDASEARQQKILETWFVFIAMRIVELWRRNNIA